MKFAGMLGGAAALALVATSAGAAGLPGPVSVPPPPAPTGFDWAGAYVGTFTNPVFRFNPWTFGFLQSGVQVGYNFVNGNLLFGIEGQVHALYTPSPFMFGAVEGVLTARLGAVIGEQTLAYAETGVLFSPATSTTVFLTGGGLEVGLGESVSLFGEAKAFFCCGTTRGIQFSFGLNYHFGN
jgi:opacity protein-like surface antigen